MTDTSAATGRPPEQAAEGPPRKLLYGLLGIVASAAAVLSFAALRDLAQTCGFAVALAWLLPVVVDAGAAAGSLVWLGRGTNAAAQHFARALALSLLGLSVAANALGHGLAAFALAPAWWVVVIVSAIAPAVLGAVVHLAVLVGRGADAPADLGETASEAAPTPKLPVVAVAPAGARRGANSKRAAARRFYDAEIGPRDGRGATELGSVLAARFGVHEATARGWVAEFRREDGDPGLEAAS